MSDENKTEQKKFAKVYPPFIDAYQVCWEEKDYIDFSTFVEWMESHALDWGSESVGTMTLVGVDPRLEGDDNKIIVCIGRWGKEKYVAYAPLLDYDSAEYWWNNIIVEQYDYPDRWDVT